MKLIEESGTTNVMEFRRFSGKMDRCDCDQELSLEYAEMRTQGWEVFWRAIEPTELEDIKEMNSHAIWS
jgi:hypothetical protein